MDAIVPTAWANRGHIQIMFT